MDKVKLNVSLPMPIFKINNNVKYAEVKKPTGVAYMILVLINETRGAKSFSKTLSNFGVPENLQYIFADTISELIDLGIIECVAQYYPDEFNICNINSFKFTKKGKKIFQEEAIPTGKDLEKRLSIYYEIPLNKLSVKLSDELEIKPLADTVFSEEDFEKYEINADLEEFYNSMRSLQIPIKKEEIITDIQTLSIEKWVGKYEVNMVIEGNDLTIKFDRDDLNDFFKHNYTGAMVSEALLYKNKFKFTGACANNLEYKNYQDSCVAIRFPQTISEMQKQKVKLAITKGNYQITNSDIVISDNSNMSVIDENIEFIEVDKSDNIYAYIPGRFVFNNELLGKVFINLLLQCKITKDQLNDLVQEILTKEKEINSDNFERFAGVVAITKQYDLLIEKLQSKLTDNVINNFILLNDLKLTIERYPKLHEGFKNMVTENFDKCCLNIDESNIDSILKICLPLKKYISYDDLTQIKMLTQNLSDMNKVELYEKLSNFGFNDMVLSTYINPVPELLEGAESSNNKLNSVINFNNNITALKTITNIKDIKDFSFDFDNLNTIRFKILFNTASNAFKEINVFKESNNELFKQYGLFMDIFSKINDNINMCEEANKDPNKINRNIIDRKITNGDYQFVLINLATKLSILLRKKFGVKPSTLAEELAEVRSKKLMDKEDIEAMYKLKECRNAQVHPEDREKVQFTSKELKEWANIIFALEEKKK